MPHLARRPQDIIHIPTWIVFNLYFVVLKLYCLFTLYVTDWGTRSGADDKNGENDISEIYVPHWDDEEDDEETVEEEEEHEADPMKKGKPEMTSLLMPHFLSTKEDTLFSSKDTSDFLQPLSLLKSTEEEEKKDEKHDYLQSLKYL
jgi:hypothetical protein